MEQVNPATTLFVVCSKTFTTQETLANASAAREWLVAELGEPAVGRHFVAVSTNHAALDAFGIAPESRFTMWDWVGGRYSLWSAVGLSIALAIGIEPFELMLAGGHDMDEHFRSAPLERNLPVLMGLIGVWNSNFLAHDSLAVLPYDRRLHRFPAYLQQLEMESNGKSVTRDGHPVVHTTGTVVWGEPGNNAQHSFFQLLHQGTARVAMDFIAPVNASSRFQSQHDLALANCLAQAEAFAFGQTELQVQADLEARGTPPEEIARLLTHKVHVGNRPVEPDPLPAAWASHARAPDRLVRAQGVRAERDLGRQPLRPVGRRARQEARGLDGARRAAGALARGAAARAGAARGGRPLARRAREPVASPR
jgi:glucose-6-phosphate isomerase